MAAWDLTAAEKRAIEAQNLPSFPINVEEIRRTVAGLLSEFGRYGFFDEYTVHNFDHIHEMLKTLDWLIDDAVRPLLTPADWMMLTLACYFHDLGLLVTRDEFAARNQSGFHEFCERELFSGPDGADYLAKVSELQPDSRERFLYQEFVRYYHAARVRAWIIGKPDVALGAAEAAAAEISRLLSPLDNVIRLDLANVCESHNLDDFEDETKYPLFRPYGRSDDEAVNLQYVAIILRTTDLIQVTNQRAPTVLFKTINPKDPVSQREWLKQNAVRHLRPRPKADRSGEVRGQILTDTIEVYANFTTAEGFFGLTSYLQYAEKQLRKSHDISEKSKKKIPKKYSFPWRYVDDTNIRTEGFIPKQFGFELDQTRILDLLTGHTLYNDSAVVVRELAQNAVDAVRLQSYEDQHDSSTYGNVFIRWTSETSELEITDNGTGMTQEVIEQHLLKVGSSRYQDSKFKEQHPNFSPISRFGIGVLSAFMVADTVEIITCSPAEEFARQISLRSVHGKYLIRLLDKKSDAAVAGLMPHGTTFKLRLRASAIKVDILAAVRRWVVFPKCRVTVQLDDQEPILVGFDSPKAALEYYLSGPLSNVVGKSSIKVVQQDDQGLSMAYALRLDPLFRDWSFVWLPRPTSYLAQTQTFSEEDATVPGLCVEGIAVQFSPPGFANGGIVAMANASGPTAPKTNVARSSLENTSESREMLRKIYNVIGTQIQTETNRLVKEEKYSLSWAISQIPYLADRFTESSEVLSDENLMTETFDRVPMFLFEEGSTRRAVSLGELKSRGEFWTVHSSLTSSVEWLVREMPGDITMRSILGLARQSTSDLPTGGVVTNIAAMSMMQRGIIAAFEISRFQGSATDRRLDLHWCVRQPKDARWLSSGQTGGRVNQFNRRAWMIINDFFRDQERSSVNRFGYPITGSMTHIPLADVPFVGLDDYEVVKVLGNFYLRFEIPISLYMRNLLKGSDSQATLAGFMSLRIVQSFCNYETSSSRRDLDQLSRELAARGLDEYLPDWSGFAEAVQASKLRVFDPLAWSRRDSELDLEF